MVYERLVCCRKLQDKKTILTLYKKEYREKGEEKRKRNRGEKDMEKGSNTG